MHKKSMEIVKQSPGSPESSHSESYAEESKGNDSDMAWANRASAADDNEDMAIDLSSTSKQDSKNTSKSSPPPQRETNSDSDES